MSIVMPCVVDVGSIVGAVGVGDLHDLAAGLRLVELLEHRRGLADADVHATTLERDVRVVERDQVVTGREVGDLVLTVLVRDRGLRLRERRRRRDHGDARQLLAGLRIGDGALHGARGVGLRVRRAGGEQAGGDDRAEQRAPEGGSDDEVLGRHGDPLRRPW
ncbi:MAG: hypothetical protein IPQ07_42375 [Myxococcales bacterium]|nr:hypothetical protein [Myxococcales bacterium]